MKVTFLGTSGYGETITRNTVSILVDDHILVDAGEGVTRRLLKRGCAGKITHVFLSHGHMDHIIGLFPLLWQYIVVDRRSSPLKIICPLYVERAIKQILELTHFPLGFQKFPLDFQGLNLEIEHDFHFAIPDYDITATVLEHQPPCIGYRFNQTDAKTRAKSFVFTGDTRPTDQVAKIASSADLLVTECSFPSNLAENAHRLNHMTPIDAATAAKAAGCTRLGLIHHPDYLLDHKTDVLKEISGIFPPKQVIFCEDKMEIMI
jgi:ribonuclease Z